MEFNSYIFIFIFVPVLFTLFIGLLNWQTFKVISLSNIILLRNSIFILFSLVFYCFITFWYAIPLFISSILDFFVGKKIFQSNDQKSKKRFLILSVCVNIGLLSIFKYTGWLSVYVADFLIILGFSASAINVPLPPGISFYTFQTMSYTIDIYKGDAKPNKSFIDYLTFVSFFPQLVAGPIERAKDLLPQLSGKLPFPSISKFQSAILMICFGLMIKIAFADNFGRLIDFVLGAISADGELAPGLGLIFAYAFAFQIYCDFSAYSTIARGVAKLFSIELSRNFLTPYFSLNPSEFWNRWHITLSRWLRDYLYIPLGGSKSGTLLTFRNLIITMVLGGLWHGAGIFFILWGLYHGLLLVLYRLVPIDRFLKRYLGNKLGTMIAAIIFFHFLCFSWILFRADPSQFLPIMNSIAELPVAIVNSFAGVSEYWAKVKTPTQFILTFNGTMEYFLKMNWSLGVILWGLIVFTLPVLLMDGIARYSNEEFADVLSRMPVLVKAIALCGMIYTIQFFGRREANEFIYFAF
jgi:alginate O-acetyltransferase complex protein AlgI